MSDTITLSRGALFERVWSTPVRVLAAEYGISNIGLAKICRKMDIPMPGLGYWARVAHGQKPKKTKLPKATASTRTEYVLQPLPKKAPTEAIPRAPGTLPDVPIAEALRSRDLQEAIRSLLATLNTSKPERDGQVRLPGHGGSFVRLSLPAKERALLILDGLAKALELRGHQMRFTERQSNYQPYKLIAVVNDIEVQMGIVEPLIRSEHRLSPEEQARFKRTGYSWGPAYDFTPSGRLIFSMGGYSGTSYKWSDGARKKLEEQLGEVVLAFEDEAVRVVAARVAEEERQVRVQEEQRAPRCRQSARQLRSGLGRGPREDG